MRKKIFIISITCCVFALMGCGTNNSFISSSASSESDASKNIDSGTQQYKKLKLLQGDIYAVDIQFHTTKKTIVSQNKIKLLEQEINGINYIRDKKSDGVKGWIYSITSKDSNGNSIKAFTIISKNEISYNGKCYKTKEEINLSSIDKITNTNRNEY